MPSHAACAESHFKQGAESLWLLIEKDRDFCHSFRRELPDCAVWESAGTGMGTVIPVQPCLVPPTPTLSWTVGGVLTPAQAHPEAQLWGLLHRPFPCFRLPGSPGLWSRSLSLRVGSSALRKQVTGLWSSEVQGHPEAFTRSVGAVCGPPSDVSLACLTLSFYSLTDSEFVLLICQVPSSMFWVKWILYKLFLRNQ